MDIGSFTFEEFKAKAADFHGYPAPGILIGGYMVELAKAHLPQGTLFEAVVESPKCLPDAVQLLTLCSVGNSWMKVYNLGRYALSLYDKYTGQGVRVALDLQKLSDWPEIRAWLLKTKPKQEQDTEKLFDEIRRAGPAVCKVDQVQLRKRLLGKPSMGLVEICPACGEPYPVKDGAICRGCQGQAPYETGTGNRSEFSQPRMRAVPVQQAVGQKAAHDMTRIVPGQDKGAAFNAGQTLAAGDVCRLQQMGRNVVYVQENVRQDLQWVHEDQAALDMAQAMAGSGVQHDPQPQEGKVNFQAARNGLFLVDSELLQAVNLLPHVICATRQSRLVVEKGKVLAGTRAIPLFLQRSEYEQALQILSAGPLLQVLPLREAKVGILVTGTEIFTGLIQDKFIPVIKSKVQGFSGQVVAADIVPDQVQAIEQGVYKLLRAGADLLITTAGLSVDPEDVTRQGLLQAGLEQECFGLPVLPGAMTLSGRIGPAQILGVPACALFYKTTSLDLLLPQLLAGLELTSRDMAAMGEGGLCLGCRACTFPKCPFGK